MVVLSSLKLLEEDLSTIFGTINDLLEQSSHQKQTELSSTPYWVSYAFMSFSLSKINCTYHQSYWRVLWSIRWLYLFLWKSRIYLYPILSALKNSQIHYRGKFGLLQTTNIWSYDRRHHAFYPHYHQEVETFWGIFLDQCCFVWIPFVWLLVPK